MPSVRLEAHQVSQARCPIASAALARKRPSPTHATSHDAPSCWFKKWLCSQLLARPRTGNWAGGGRPGPIGSGRPLQLWLPALYWLLCAPSQSDMAACMRLARWLVAS